MTGLRARGGGSRVRIAAYVYTGWHPIPERDAAIHPDFTEWELVAACRPRFPGHVQPRLPLLGTYDDRDPTAVGTRVRLAAEYGIDVLVFGVFWCRGKRVFEEALERGFLGSPEGASMPFAVFWANRLPRHVLPVRRRDLPVIEEHRRVSSDVEDFVALITLAAERWFVRPNYLRIAGRPWFAIYDSTFFVRELGVEAAREAVQRARRSVRAAGLPDFHLVAIDPAAAVIGSLRDIGFDGVTHYVLLPEWKGPLIQDYATCARRSAGLWDGFRRASGLRYAPSVSPGWDASPRACDAGRERPGKYPWSPVVVGEHPALFHEALERAVRWAERSDDPEPIVFVASLNEWSEGHYLEPDTRFGFGWLEAVRALR